MRVSTHTHTHTHTNTYAYKHTHTHTCTLYYGSQWGLSYLLFVGGWLGCKATSKSGCAGQELEFVNIFSDKTYQLLSFWVFCLNLALRIATHLSNIYIYIYIYSRIPLGGHSLSRPLFSSPDFPHTLWDNPITRPSRFTGAICGFKPPNILYKPAAVINRHQNITTFPLLLPLYHLCVYIYIYIYMVI